jgi:hypothetical protein
MRRLNVHLRAFEEGRYVELLNRDEVSERRQKVIAKMQARFDHLAGVQSGATVTKTSAR